MRKLILDVKCSASCVTDLFQICDFSARLLISCPVIHKIYVVAVMANSHTESYRITTWLVNGPACLPVCLPACLSSEAWWRKSQPPHPNHTWRRHEIEFSLSVGLSGFYSWGLLMTSRRQNHRRHGLSWGATWSVRTAAVWMGQCPRGFGVAVQRRSRIDGVSTAARGNDPLR